MAANMKQAIQVNAEATSKQAPAVEMKVQEEVKKLMDGLGKKPNPSIETSGTTLADLEMALSKLEKISPKPSELENKTHAEDIIAFGLENLDLENEDSLEDAAILFWDKELEKAEKRNQIKRREVLDQVEEFKQIFKKLVLENFHECCELVKDCPGWQERAKKILEIAGTGGLAALAANFFTDSKNSIKTGIAVALMKKVYQDRKDKKEEDEINNAKKFIQIFAGKEVLDHLKEVETLSQFNEKVNLAADKLIEPIRIRYFALISELKPESVEYLAQFFFSALLESMFDLSLGNDNPIPELCRKLVPSPKHSLYSEHFLNKKLISREGANDWTIKGALLEAPGCNVDGVILLRAEDDGLENRLDKYPFACLEMDEGSKFYKYEEVETIPPYKFKYHDNKELTLDKDQKEIVKSVLGKGKEDFTEVGTRKSLAEYFKLNRDAGNKNKPQLLEKLLDYAIKECTLSILAYYDRNGKEISFTEFSGRGGCRCENLLAKINIIEQGLQNIQKWIGADEKQRPKIKKLKDHLAVLKKIYFDASRAVQKKSLEHRFGGLLKELKKFKEGPFGKIEEIHKAFIEKVFQHEEKQKKLKLDLTNLNLRLEGLKKTASDRKQEQEKLNRACANSSDTTAIRRLEYTLGEKEGEFEPLIKEISIEADALAAELQILKKDYISLVNNYNELLLPFQKLLNFVTQLQQNLSKIWKIADDFNLISDETLSKNHKILYEELKNLKNDLMDSLEKLKKLKNEVLAKLKKDLDELESNFSALDKLIKQQGQQGLNLSVQEKNLQPKRAPLLQQFENDARKKLEEALIKRFL